MSTKSTGNSQLYSERRRLNCLHAYRQLLQHHRLLGSMRVKGKCDIERQFYQSLAS